MTQFHLTDGIVFSTAEYSELSVVVHLREAVVAGECGKIIPGIFLAQLDVVDVYIGVLLLAEDLLVLHSNYCRWPSHQVPCRSNRKKYSHVAIFYFSVRASQSI